MMRMAALAVAVVVGRRGRNKRARAKSIRRTTAAVAVKRLPLIAAVLNRAVAMMVVAVVATSLVIVIAVVV